MDFRLHIEVAEQAGGAVAFVVRAAGEARTHRLTDRSPQAYAALLAEWAQAYGTRPPRERMAPAGADPGFRPLITENLNADILYGYGDPCVVRTEEGWWCVATSNDAAQSFPILRSDDLVQWEPAGFMFPAGAKPAWAMDGEGSDYWAPEIHRSGEGWLACFTARAKDGGLAIGLARAAEPQGPWTADAEPLLSGGVIDGHLLVEPGRTLLFWKEDSNDRWPSLTAALLAAHPELIPEVFPNEADRWTAMFAAALWRWIARLPPMERFSMLQAFIAAVAEDFAGCDQRLEALRRRADLHEPLGEIRQAMRTRIFAQPLDAQGRLVGERTLVLQNDQPWEAHLIEGMWITRAEGRYWMFYSGNDFATPRYGIGVAVADDALGPYRKAEAPFLTSTERWWGPGHPSVAEGPDGRPWLFLHAFRPGAGGYKAFRALLGLPLMFGAAGVRPA